MFMRYEFLRQPSDVKKFEIEKDMMDSVIIEQLQGYDGSVPLFGPNNRLQELHILDSTDVEINQVVSNLTSLTALALDDISIKPKAKKKKSSESTSFVVLPNLEDLSISGIYDKIIKFPRTPHLLNLTIHNRHADPHQTTDLSWLNAGKFLERVDIEDPSIANLDGLPREVDDLDTFIIASSKISSFNGIPKITGGSSPNEFSIESDGICGQTSFFNIVDIDPVMLNPRKMLRLNNICLNDIKGLPDELDAELISFTGDSIKTLRGFPSYLNHASKLYLDKNLIDDSSIVFFPEATNLNTLELHDNKLSESAIVLADKYPNLELLNLRGNKDIRSVSLIDLIQNLDATILIDTVPLINIKDVDKFRRFIDVNLVPSRYDSIEDRKMSRHAFDLALQCLSNTSDSDECKNAIAYHNMTIGDAFDIVKQSDIDYDSPSKMLAMDFLAAEPPFLHIPPLFMTEKLREVLSEENIDPEVRELLSGLLNAYEDGSIGGVKSNSGDDNYTIFL